MNYDTQITLKTFELLLPELPDCRIKDIMVLCMHEIGTQRFAEVAAEAERQIDAKNKSTESNHHDQMG